MARVGIIKALPAAFATIAFISTHAVTAQDCPTAQSAPRGFVVERGERDGRLHFTNTDYFSSDLKLIIAKEWKERDGKTTLVKFDRIYPIKH